MPALSLSCQSALRPSFTESLIKQDKTKSLESKVIFHIPWNLHCPSLWANPLTFSETFSFCILILSFISLCKWRKEAGVMDLGCHQCRLWTTGNVSVLFFLFPASVPRLARLGRRGGEIIGCPFNSRILLWPEKVENFPERLLKKEKNSSSLIIFPPH